ncbi:chaperone required for assembly of F1-ATPase [Methylopila capsulata]|uniref:ATPase n=1 Tax=Methylopila capsulata TaxID=61654 RepID=A0A9W6MTW2_9HYPH|nr:ATP12 family protein [Methylopila capsulata]MBM7852981.1 chaperone required for assembly of F1-ATPase [Methylopila capsulata]GLK57808.1 ATPase [Methylopila capsulata]
MSAGVDALGRPALPKRFYKAAEAVEREGLWAIALDGKTTRTPGRTPLAFADRALAEEVAAEWAAQGATIDPATMPLTRLANAAIDGVAGEREAVAAEIVKYAGSDLVCYRADAPDRLVARQSAQWDPVLAFARDELGARFVLAEGVMFVEQSAEALEAVDRAVPRDDVFVLAGLSVVTTLTGSALIALAVHRGRLSVDDAWAAAHVDEDWNVELWGSDAEALARRAARRRDMDAAVRMARGGR